MRKTLVVVALVALSAGTYSQQLQPNSPGARILTDRAIPPTPGRAFPVNVIQGESMAFQVVGAPLSPLILLAGQLANPSTAILGLGGQFLDIDLNGMAIVADGFGGTGLLPQILGFTDGIGSAPFGFPTNLAFLNQTLAFQGLLADPTGPLGLRFTAAINFLGSSALTMSGDDDVQEFVFPSVSYDFYGQTYTSVSVSTNGWIRFGGDALLAGRFASYADFIRGGLGDLNGPLSNSQPGLLPSVIPAAPGIAALWADLRFSGGTSVVTAEENQPGLLEVTWENASLLNAAAPFGTVRCTVDIQSGSPVVTLDYTGVLNVPIAPSFPFAGPLVGITDGGTAAGVLSEFDLLSAGAVVATTPTTNVNAFVQDFTGNGVLAAEPFDLAGSILTFADQSTTSAGDFRLF